MKYSISLLFPFVLLFHLAEAQQLLLVKKVSGNRIYEYLEGDTIRIKVAPGGAVLQGGWQYAGGEAIRIAQQTVPLSAIQWIDVSDKEKGIWVLRTSQNLLLLAGLGYFAVAHVNIPIETGKVGFDPHVARTSAILVGGGLLSRGLDRTLRKRRLPVQGKRYQLSLIGL
jgi:hypothetical protein